MKDGLAVFRFHGEGAAEAFEQEAGGHRFQRVPPTEKKGRRQSSTVTVAVLPEPTPVELKVPAKDLKYETYRGSGPGGQNVNKNDTAVRITHIPTGVQACSEIKSQFQNKKLALGALMARLAARAEKSTNDRRNGNRKSQVGTGMRADKIRTYAEQRGRVENHLNGKRAKIRDYDKGFVELLH